MEVRARSGKIDKLNIMELSVIYVTYQDFANGSFDDIYRKIMKMKKKAKLAGCSICDVYK